LNNGHGRTGKCFNNSGHGTLSKWLAAGGFPHLALDLSNVGFWLFIQGRENGVIRESSGNRTNSIDKDCVHPFLLQVLQKPIALEERKITAQMDEKRLA
jgi:hypothetical protein